MQGGELVAMGPNWKYCSTDYMDFIDHTLLLSHKSLCEALVLAGFQIKECIPKFLPFSCQEKQPPIWMLKAYLKMPFAWKFFGKQFLITAIKT